MLHEISYIEKKKKNTCSKIINAFHASCFIFTKHFFFHSIRQHFDPTVTHDFMSHTFCILTYVLILLQRIVPCPMFHSDINSRNHCF